MPLLTKAALTYLMVTGATVGIWAYGFPANFYRGFPGFGRMWIAVDGPFNEHLVRDTGAAYLMIATLAILGLLRPATGTVFGIGVTTFVFNAAHFGFHMMRLGIYAPLDRTLNVLALGSALLSSLWLMMPRARVRA